MHTNLLVAGGLTLALAGSFIGLQVYSQRAATLSRIAALDSCLAVTNRQRAEAARVMLASIERSVARNPNQAADVWVLQQAQRIQRDTQVLVDTLQHLRKDWPGPGYPAALAQLSIQVRQYVDSMRLYVPESAARAESTQARTQLDGLNPLRIPTPAIAATLTRVETQVWQLATEALTRQAEKVGNGGCDLCFDKIGAFAIPAANTVEPGALYEARLMISAAAGGYKLHMKANGRDVSIDPRTNQGLVSFRVPAAHTSQPDTVRAQWHGQIGYNFSGKDTVQQLTVPYYIVKRSRP